MNGNSTQTRTQFDISRGRDGARTPIHEQLARAERAKAVQTAREAFWRRAPSVQ